ncbi:MAG: hypothetical protein ILO68_00005, partial [Clostridia bacterium]|nr:hypothetical protein [Clostridia bacterium]
LETEKELEKLTGELEALSGGISPEDAAKAETKRKELRIGRISLAAAAIVFLALGIVFIRISTVAGICLFAASALCLAGVGVCFLFGDRLAKSLGASGEKDLKKRLEAVPEEQKRREETLRSLNAVRTEIAGRQEMEDALGAEIQNGIRSYRMELGTDFPTQLQLLIDACQNVARLDTRRKEKKAAYEAALGGRNLHELEKAAEGALEPQRSRELAEREDRFLAQQRDMLASQEKDKIARLSSLQANAEDPAVLTGKLEAVRAAIADGNVKYAAYEAARKGIEEASDLMKARIAPQVGERAGLYFQAATGGAYRTLEMDTALSMTTGAGGVSHDADYLSAGTKDLAALSKRLALIDVLFDGMGVPIVLDDAFGRLDDGRLTATARMLGEAASHHQILILACCDRERKAFERAGVPFALSLGVGNGGETPEER